MRNDAESSTIRPDNPRGDLVVTGRSRSCRRLYLFARCAGARDLRPMRAVLSSAALVIFAGPVLLFSQTIKQRSHDIKNGERIFKSGCIACHGAGGRGAPETMTEFRRPDTFPDFRQLF